MSLTPPFPSSLFYLFFFSSRLFNKKREFQLDYCSPNPTHLVCPSKELYSISSFHCRSGFSMFVFVSCICVSIVRIRTHYTFCILSIYREKQFEIKFICHKLCVDPPTPHHPRLSSFPKNKLTLELKRFFFLEKNTRRYRNFCIRTAFCLFDILSKQQKNK